MALKLTYFNDKARAAVTATAFRIAKIPFELETFTFPEWSAIKEDISRFPLGQVPVLTLPDGRIIAQSAAIARYAGRVAGLYSEDPLESLQIDEIIDTSQEVLSSCPQNPDVEIKKKLREEWAAGKLQRFLKFFAGKVASGTYIVGGKLTIADLFLFFTLRGIRSGNYDFVPTDSDSAYPALGAYYEFIKADPQFAQYA